MSTKVMSLIDKRAEKAFASLLAEIEELRGQVRKISSLLGEQDTPFVSDEYQMLLARVKGGDRLARVQINKLLENYTTNEIKTKR